MVDGADAGAVWAAEEAAMADGADACAAALRVVVVATATGRGGWGARGAVVAEPGGVRRRCAVGGAAGTMAGLNTVVSARNGSESGGAPAVALRQDSDASARPSVRGASHGSLRPTSCWLR